jgi:hypothetical protein
MILRQSMTSGLLSLAVFTAGSFTAGAQAGSETFSATATVRTAAPSAAVAPVTITVDRKMSKTEADGLVAAFKEGGAAALRKALVGVKPTGSVKLGTGEATPTRLTIERTTDKGRLLTMVTDKPILFLGAGLPGAKPKEGYDFAIIDIEVDAKDAGSGTLAPAAKVTLKDGVFAVEDYGAELVRLTGVKKVK